MFAEPSIRRQLIFWLVVPLSLALACCPPAAVFTKGQAAMRSRQYPSPRTVAMRMGPCSIFLRSRWM